MSEQGDFWSKASDAKKQEKERERLVAKDPDLPVRQRKGRRRRIILWSLAILVLLVLGAVGFAPAIASGFVPGIVSGQSGKAVAGALSLESASLSWGGPQRVTGFRLATPDGKTVATANAEVSVGLLALARGGLDLGQITITSATADIVRLPGGDTNLQKAIAAPKTDAKPAPASGKSETRLPPDLKATLVIQKLTASYEDRSAGPDVAGLSVRVENLKAKADIDVGEAAIVELSCSAAPKGSKPGEIQLKARADNWSRDDGLLSLDKLKINADVTATDVPVELLDAVAGPVLGAAADGSPVTLVRALGDRLQLTLEARGTASEGDARFSVELPNAQASGSAKVVAGVLESTAPVTVSVKGEALRWLAKGLDQSLAKSADTATIQTLPDASVRIDRLKFALPSGEAKPDYRGSGVVATVKLSQTSGTVRLAKGSPMKPFTIAPLELTLDAPDLAAPARIQGRTSAAIDGQPSGELNVDLTARGLVTSTGDLGGMPRDVQGGVVLRGLATAIVQPFVSGAGIDVPEDIGPTLNLAANATTTDGKTLAVNLTGDAAHMTLAAAVDISESQIATRDQGIRFTLSRAGKIAEKLISPETGWAISPWSGTQTAGVLEATVSSLQLPLKNGAPDLAGAKVQAAASIGQLVAAAIGPDRKPLPGADLVNVIKIDIKASQGAEGALAAVKADLGYAGKPFNVSVDASAPTLFAAGGAVESDPFKLAPKARVVVNDLPTQIGSLVSALSGKQEAGKGEKPMDLAAVLEAAAGSPVDLTATLAPAKQADTLAAGVEIRSTFMKTDVTADLARDRVAFTKITGQNGFTPASLTAILQQVAATALNGPRLAADTQVVWSVMPVTIPLNAERAPQLDKVATAEVRLSVPGKLLVNNLLVKEQDGSTKDLGAIGVGPFNVVANLPVAAMVGPGLESERALRAKLTGTVRGLADAALAELDADVNAVISDARPKGPARIRARLDALSTGALEALIEKPGLLTGLIGTGAQVELTVGATPDVQGDFAAGRIDAELAVSAPRLRTTGPLQLAISPGSMVLAKPSTLSMDVEPGTINKFLAPPGQDNAQTGTRLAEPATIQVNLERLSLPRALPEGSTLKPAPFDVGFAASSPVIKLVGSDGKLVTAQQVEARAETKPAPKGVGGGPRLEFRVGIGQATVGDAPPATNLGITGVVANLVNDKGQLDTTGAVLTAKADMANVPTALLDTAAGQDGALVEGLGPTVAFKLDADRVTLGNASSSGPPPMLEAKAESKRATLKLKGSVSDGLYRSVAPVEFNIFELTQLFTRRYIGVVPLVGTLEKTTKDSPAMVTASDLTVPLSKDPARLNGDVLIDPGECRFTTGKSFGGILKAFGQKSEGALGQRLEPLRINIRNGVCTYQPWTLPAGEFKVETSGSVDLVKREVDVVTWIPVGALTEKALGLFKVPGIAGVLGSLTPGMLDNLTKLPFRTKGPMDNPETKADLELFGKNVIKQLRPDEIIKRNLGGTPEKTPPPSTPK